MQKIAVMFGDSWRVTLLVVGPFLTENFVNFSCEVKNIVLCQMKLNPCVVRNELQKTL